MVRMQKEAGWLRMTAVPPLFVRALLRGADAVVEALDEGVDVDAVRERALLDVLAQPRQPMPALMKTSAVSGYFWTTSRMLISFVIAMLKPPDKIAGETFLGIPETPCGRKPSWGIPAICFAL